MSKPHKHAELIKAWADGAEIQYRYYMHTCSKGAVYSEWMNEENPDWNLDREYRIKPEPKPDVLRFTKVFKSSVGTWTTQGLGDNLKLTFDGETGELKSAEVLK